MSGTSADLQARLADAWKRNAELTMAITAALGRLVDLLMRHPLVPGSAGAGHVAAPTAHTQHLFTVIEQYRSAMEGLVFQYEAARTAQGRSLGLLQEEVRLLRRRNERLERELEVERAASDASRANALHQETRCGLAMQAVHQALRALP